MEFALQVWLITDSADPLPTPAYVLCVGYFITWTMSVVFLVGLALVNISHNFLFFFFFLSLNLFTFRVVDLFLCSLFLLVDLCISAANEADLSLALDDSRIVLPRVRLGVVYEPLLLGTA